MTSLSEENCKYSMAALFSNHLILNEIAKNLKLRELKNARSVNKLWNTVFSRRIANYFPEEKDFLNFLEFYSTKKNKLKIYTKSFLFYKNDLRTPNKYLEFIKWSNISFATHLYQLMSLCQVKSLVLPEIKSLATLKTILEAVSPTLEDLEIFEPGYFFSTHYEKRFLKELHSIRDRKVQAAKKLGLMPKLKTISVHFKEHSTFNRTRFEIIEYLHYNFGEFFEELVNSSFKTFTELKLNGVTSIIVKILLNKNLPNLKTLNFLGYPCFISPLIREIFEIVDKFKIENIFLCGQVYLNWKNLKNFVKVLALYDEDWAHLKEKEEYFSNLEITDVHFFHDVYLKLPLDKMLFHFPNLKRLNIKYKNSLKEIKKVKCSSLEDFDYLAPSNYKMPFISKIVSEAFPNLIKLNLCINGRYSTRLNLIPIIENLKKLEEFYFKQNNSYLSFLPDRDLTGIPNDFIRNNLRGKSYEFLRDFDINSLPKRDHIGIANLKELRKFEMNVNRSNFAISLFFGFRFLTKLRCLRILSDNSVCLSEENMRIFIDDFEVLNDLTLPKADEEFSNEIIQTNNDSIMKEIADKRPFLNFEFQRTESVCVVDTSDDESDTDEDE